MSSKIATAILTAGISLASPTYGKIATLGILGDKSKKPAGSAGAVAKATTPLSGGSSASGTSSSSSSSRGGGVLPVSNSVLGDPTEAALSRGKLLGN